MLWEYYNELNDALSCEVLSSDVKLSYAIVRVEPWRRLVGSAGTIGSR